MICTGTILPPARGAAAAFELAGWPAAAVFCVPAPGFQIVQTCTEIVNSVSHKYNKAFKYLLPVAAFWDNGAAALALC